MYFRIDWTRLLDGFNFFKWIITNCWNLSTGIPSHADCNTFWQLLDCSNWSTYKRNNLNVVVTYIVLVVSARNLKAKKIHKSLSYARLTIYVQNNSKRCHTIMLKYIIMPRKINLHAWAYLTSKKQYVLKLIYVCHPIGSAYPKYILKFLTHNSVFASLHPSTNVELCFFLNVSPYAPTTKSPTEENVLILDGNHLSMVNFQCR